jgi:predicted DCC family thiol-disulfide oxidoreductase YuxK
MREHTVEDIAEQPEEKRNTNEAYQVLYDGQCEVCQSCVSWLRTVDHESKAICLPISAEILSAVDSRLQMDECLRQMHVVTPEGEIHVGWDAVACLARLFPSTWLIGALGQRFPFSNAGRFLYGFIAKNRYSLSKSSSHSTTTESDPCKLRSLLRRRLQRLCPLPATVSALPCVSLPRLRLRQHGGHA